MTVFFEIGGHTRRAEFHRFTSRAFNSKTQNEVEAEASLILLNRFGTLEPEDKIEIEGEGFRVINRSELKTAPQYSVYKLVRIGRGDRIY